MANKVLFSTALAAAATVPASVPEPGGWPVLALGLAALGFAAQRRQTGAQ